MKEQGNAVKEAAKAMQQRLKALGHDVSYSHCLEIASKQAGVANWRAAKAILAGQPIVNSPTEKEPRVLVIVSGGVASTIRDNGVDVEIFDWDNYNDDPEGAGGVSAHFADLAEPLDIPVEGVLNHNSELGVTAELPEMCFVFRQFATPGNWIVAVKRGESGCYKTTYDELNIEKAKKLVSSLNGRLGITAEQAECMLNGSMFGWDTRSAKLSSVRANTPAVKTLVFDDHEPSVQSDVEFRHTEILQHDIKWFLRENGLDGVPAELDECSIEHIEKCVKDGYNQGELCIFSSDGDTEYRGWWWLIK